VRMRLRVVALQMATMLCVCVGGVGVITFLTLTLEQGVSVGGIAGVVVSSATFGSMAWLCAKGAERLMPPPIGYCQSCGYNREGIAPDMRCPECGEID
jgi:hypothetical protein